MIIYILFLSVIYSLMIIDRFLIIEQSIDNNRTCGIGTNNDQNYSTNRSLSSIKKFSYPIKLAIIIVFLFSIFRFDVGWDYLAYYNTIKYGAITNIVSLNEYATIFLVKLSQITGITNLYFAINSFVCIFFISKTIKNYSEDYWLSIIFFVCFPLFFLNSLSVIRIFSALALTFYGFKYIEKRNPFRYILIVLLAGMFHKSAFIAIVFYFAYSIKLNTSKLVVVLLSLPLAGNILNNLVIKFIPRYAVYTHDTLGKEGTKSILIFIIIGVILLILNKRITSTDKVANTYYNVYFIGLSIYLMFYNQGTMGHRLSLYGTIYSILLVPKIVSLFKYPKDRVLINSMIYLLCIIMFILTVNVGADTYIPYKTIFSIR